MSDIGNKDVFARTLSYYVEKSGKTRAEICQDLGIVYSTFSEWINGRTYPRIDRIELLAKYFGIKKSQLIESEQPEDKKDPPSADSERWERFRAKYDKLPAVEQHRIDAVLDAMLSDPADGQDQ